MDVLPEFLSPELAVVMPVFNEAANIGSVLREWFAVLERATPRFVLFAIDDGSRDQTAAILAALRPELGPRLHPISKANSGHGRTCREGYELALSERATWILQIDSDGQCDPAYFGHFYENRANCDCVFGYRRTRGDGFPRLAVSRLCRAAVWLATGTYLPDPNVPYRLVRAGALQRALQYVPHDFELQNIALAVVLKRLAGERWKSLPIHFRGRQGGENSINYQKIAKLGLQCLRDFSRITHEDSHRRWRPHWLRRRVAT